MEVGTVRERSRGPRRSTFIRRSQIAHSSKRIRPNKARKAKNFERAYGGSERREWVESKPCIACGHAPPSENAHVPPKGEHGTGYKGDARFVVPFCGDRLSEGRFVLGCHTLYDKHRQTFVRLYPGLDVQAQAAKLEQEWQLYQEAA